MKDWNRKRNIVTNVVQKSQNIIVHEKLTFWKRSKWYQHPPGSQI